MQEQFGIELPSYSDSPNTADLAEYELLTATELGRGAWTKADAPRAGDAALFRIDGRPVHVGVVVDPPWFLHTRRKNNAVVERYDATVWARRFLGAYRHVALA